MIGGVLDFKLTDRPNENIGNLWGGDCDTLY